MSIVALVEWLNWPKRLRKAEAMAEFWEHSFREIDKIASSTRETTLKVIETKDATIEDHLKHISALTDNNARLAHQVEAEREKVVSLREEVAILQGKLKRAGKSIAFASGKAKRKAVKKPATA